MQCGYEERARSELVSPCGKSADGTSCDFFSYIDWVDSDFCYGHGPGGDCTSDCRSALESYRDDMRCCLSISNDSFGYSVWEDCGLEPPVLCTDSTLTLTPVENPQSCQDELDRIIYTDFYCAAAGQYVVDALTECGNDDAKLFVNFCGSNDRGEQCLDVVIDDNSVCLSVFQLQTVVPLAVRPL